jgi:hypothetical protein
VLDSCEMALDILRIHVPLLDREFSTLYGFPLILWVWFIEKLETDNLMGPSTP